MAPPTQPPDGPSVASDLSSLYDALAPVYDRWQRCDGLTPFSQLVLTRLVPVLGGHVRGAARSFVDLGCGTGDLLLGLGRARPGWRLHGVDGSAGMLAVARDKPGADRITWQRGALDRLALPAPPFDAAGCFFDTLNHLDDLAGLRAVFDAVAAGLAPGGLFVFDATNEVGFASWWSNHRVWRGQDRDGAWCVDITMRYDRARGVGHADTVIDHGGDRTAATLTERCFAEADIRAALAAAGLKVLSREPWSPFETDAAGKTWWISVKST